MNLKVRPLAPATIALQFTGANREEIDSFIGIPSEDQDGRLINHSLKDRHVIDVDDYIVMTRDGPRAFSPREFSERYDLI